MEQENLTIPPDGRPMEEQPRWRQDFPIDWPLDHYVARRDFTKFMVMTSFALTVGQFWIVLQNYLRQRRGHPPLVLIARADEIPVGGTLVFSYPGIHDRCLLVRLTPDNYVAYSQKCTHLSCSVVPELSLGRLRCPCHEGIFEIATGRPVAGPPRRPLTRIQLKFSQSQIYAAGLELRTQ